MTMPKRLVQAYRQAPWRTQTRRAALVLVAAIMMAAVVWVMLSVAVEAATAGLQIQQMELKREVVLREISDMRTQYAQLTSTERMAKRAAELGFVPVRPENLTYVVVPGYTGRQPKIEAQPRGSSAQVKGDQAMLKPGYSQSLWEWLLEGVLDMQGTPGGLR